MDKSEQKERKATMVLMDPKENQEAKDQVDPPVFQVFQDPVDHVEKKVPRVKTARLDSKEAKETLDATEKKENLDSPVSKDPQD